MSPEARKRYSGWLPTVFVLVVVLFAGSRLIMLSLERHADDSRVAARSAVMAPRRSVESQLSGLAARATTEATLATRARANGGSAGSALPARGSFIINRDGTLTRSSKAEPTLAPGIASEWATSDTASGGTESNLLGPIRHGSQWIIAARAPIVDGEDGASARVGWVVAYVDLDQLMTNAKLGRLIPQGYDFALSQKDLATRRTRPFVYSGPSLLDDPVVAVIRTPPGFSTGIRGSVLELEIRPRDGWYPPARLASEIGLLALVAWLLAFGTHDLIIRSRHLKAQLAESQARQVALGEQLMGEIEEREGLQKSFDHARYHDAFTGLPNRRFFMDQLDRALRELRARRRQGISVVVVDIDRFKLINETLGHAAGDELMVQAAQRFETAAAGMECILARWEGEQFAMLLFDAPTPEAALGVAATLQASLKEPFVLRRHRVAITARMGVTSADSGLRRAEDLLREADIAVSAAKRAESVRIAAYAPSMGGDAASLVSLEADLHLALERNELRLLFQPIIDLRTKQAVGAEALLRWQHPVEGLLRPDKFLSIAEEAGLMVPITRWVIARVCKLAGDWRQRLEPGVPFYLSVNLSAASLRDPYLADYVSNMLDQTNALASSLKFEITEAGLLNNVGEAREVLHRLHDMGIELMLDDFGTGYSSLNHLELFPFDFVKIDRPFVSRIGADSANSGIMAAVVQIAASLGLKAIAEVIETQAVAQALQKMGCNFGQGYFFGAPVEAEEALQRMRGRDWTLVGLGVTDSGSRPAPLLGSGSGPEDDSPTLVLPVVSR
ncbi:MAG: EAL domain-containing protein [Gammaproteobacteria bacterium]